MSNKKPGRPKLPDGEKLEFDKVSVLSKTKKIIVKAAEDEGVPIYVYVKKVVDDDRNKS